jgi:murein DD-endopeptidase MepM/ murein hydrolase activator NlpD
MGDHRPGAGDGQVAAPVGKRVARHASEKIASEPYVGRRIAPQAPPPVPSRAPAAEVVHATVPLPVTPAPVATEAVTRVAPRPTSRPSSRPTTRVAGRRAATRRSPFPSVLSAPVLMGVAVLGVSVAGALQAVHPSLANRATQHHLTPASALSGSSAVGSASLLGGRAAVVSRDSNRQTLSLATGTSLQAAADAQAKQRDAALSAFAAKAEQTAAKLKLHQWVLPVQPGVYQLTARFGDYSALWSHFHTGLDFASPTGTPIMAVAGGTITEVGYSGAYGNRTIETLPDGTELWYCHQNAFGTSVGATVRPGQVIGYVGSTGNVTGPHLHLEVHPGGGDPVDPYTALEVHGLHP